MEKKSIKRWEETGSVGVERERGRGDFFKIFIIYSLYFFLISTKIGPQVFVGTEGKVDYATRVMRGHQKVGVLTNSLR